MTAAQVVWMVVLGLLAVSLYGLLAVRNLIKQIIVLQLLAKAVILALVAAGASSGQLALSQSLAATAIVADTVLATVALALAVKVRQRCGTLDVQALSRLRE
ncbi:MAG: NADH-quinone oxidoreductase subunit K [Chloroflexi bacterium]|nr:NADH-quinone oxidoreductase subunit K [Chloroflexota bacterium]